MSNLMQNQHALILGVANKWSIAWAIAQAFHREGAKLIFTYASDRQKQTVEELAAEVGADVLPCDVTSDEQITAVAAALAGRGVTLHSVVHSVAFADRDSLSKPFVETTRAGFALAHDVSAYSLVAVSKAFAPLMAEGGSITTLSYLGAVRVVENYNVMGVAKAALEASVRYLANDLGAKGIRVNAISAGAIKTTSARGVKDFSKLLDSVAAMSPLKRTTDATEVADTAVFLASNLGRGVTGNVLYVDAGFQIMAVKAG